MSIKCDFEHRMKALFSIKFYLLLRRKNCKYKRKITLKKFSSEDEIVIDNFAAHSVRKNSYFLVERDYVLF